MAARLAPMMRLWTLHQGDEERGCVRVGSDWKGDMQGQVVARATKASRLKQVCPHAMARVS